METSSNLPSTKEEEITISKKDSLTIAFVGCSHGFFDRIYAKIAQLEEKQKVKVDLLLCCGDFECVRDDFDLSQLAGPAKYHFHKDFRKYYNGEKVAPILTIFIGGNHEASNYSQELYYGGWVCKNIYFLGNSGVINVGGIRIAGFSGIFKHYDFQKGYYETTPYTEDEKRSVYHVRQYELFKLGLVKQPVDVVMSHDWPFGVIDHGDKDQLLKEKPYFREDYDKGQFGCKEYKALMDILQPRYWLSGHMHAFYKAAVKHEGSQKETLFLAADKAQEDWRHFVEIIQVPVTQRKEITLTLDKEWLAILKATEDLLFYEKAPPVRKNTFRVKDTTLLKQVEEFSSISDDKLLAPSYAVGVKKGKDIINPQTHYIINLAKISKPFYPRTKK